MEQLLTGGEPELEGAVTAPWRWVLAPLGLRVEALSRVPYPCRGDPRRPVEVLDDAVFAYSLAPSGGT